MTDSRHPRYPVADGRPGLTAAELRTDEHPVAPESSRLPTREGFQHDAVETLDTGKVLDYESPAHAMEALDLRGDYTETDVETLARCLEAKQAQLEEQGFAALKSQSMSVWTERTIDGMDAADRQLLDAYVTAGSPVLEDEPAMDGLAADFGMETPRFRLQLRKSVRRLARLIESDDATDTAETSANGEGGTERAHVELALSYLAEQYERFSDRRRTSDDEDYPEFEDHMRGLSSLTEVLKELGLEREEERRVFYRFHGLDKGGRVPVADIARDSGKSVAEIETFVSDVTGRLAKASWQPGR